MINAVSEPRLKRSMRHASASSSADLDFAKMLTTGQNVMVSSDAASSSYAGPPPVKLITKNNKVTSLRNNGQQQ